MDDNLKGYWIMITVFALFIVAILGFLIQFPLEQQISYTDAQSMRIYNNISNASNINIVQNLQTVDNTTTTSFDQWDITQGFMGSNALKQGSSTNAKASATQVFNVLITLSEVLFDPNSPFTYVFLVLSALAATVVVLVVIKWIRQGN